jgi:hypothetical protein
MTLAATAFFPGEGVSTLGKTDFSTTHNTANRHGSTSVELSLIWTPCLALPLARPAEMPET